MSDGNTIDASDEPLDDPAEAVDDPDAPLEDTPFVCGNGSPWGEQACGPCDACLAETGRNRAAVAAAVTAGTLSETGHETRRKERPGQASLF